MPTNEPTPEERQRLAFEHLRRETLEAHTEGDGLRINLLCQTAFDGIEHLLSEDNFRLTLTDVKWAFIFQFYWLLDHYNGHLASALLKKLPHRNERDKSLGRILELHQHLIQEPLTGINSIVESVLALPLDALSPDPLAEEIELLTHLAELIWFRGTSQSIWKDLLDQWQKRGAPWLVQLSKVVKNRLEWQTRLVVPSISNPSFPESALSDARVQFDLADLWLLQLHGRRGAIVARVRELSPSLNADSYRWRIVSDFWHTNRFLGPQDSDEQQARWLARRRSLTANSPLLQFHDRRGTIISEKLGDIYRENAASTASLRRDVLQLAMLHEIAALRLWDYGLWREATGAQSEVMLESSLWMTDQPSLVTHGLMLGIASLSLRSASKDSITRRAIERLEFAPQAVFLNFAEQLFEIYPLQTYRAVELLDRIADLLPPPTWQRLAEWSITTVRELDDNRSTGQKTGPLAFWKTILPSVNKASPVWSILFPEAVSMASNQLCWHGDSASFLGYWLLHAPLALAQEVGNAMARITPSEKVLSFDRAGLLANVEDDRPEFGHQFTRMLPWPAPSYNERMLLSKHLDLDSRDSEHAVGKSVFTKKLLERLPLLIVPEVGPPPQIPFERSGIDHVERWDISEIQLLADVISTLEHPRVNTAYISELLNVVQLLIRNGPLEFSAIFRPKVKEWVVRLSDSTLVPQGQEHPFSISHFSNPGIELAREQLAWIVFQYLVKDGINSLELLNTIVDEAIINHWGRSTGILIRCLIVVASRLPASSAAPKLLDIYQLLDGLRLQMPSNKNAIVYLSEALDYIAGIIGPSCGEWIAWDDPLPNVLLPNLAQTLSPILIAMAASSHVALRVTTARILAFLEARHCLPERLGDILTNLLCDNRARVRFAAKTKFPDP
jgi:hypothetical protein